MTGTLIISYIFNSERDSSDFLSCIPRAQNGNGASQSTYKMSNWLENHIDKIKEL